MFSILKPVLIRKYIRSSDNTQMLEEFVPLTHVPNFSKTITQGYRLDNGAPVPYITKTESSDLRKKFYYNVVKQANPDNIPDAVEFLKETQNNPHLLFVVGETKSKHTKNVPRTKIAFDTHNSKFNLVAFDIDSWVDVDAPSPVELEMVGDYISKLLSKYFSEYFPPSMGYIVLASSSAGVSAGIRSHFYFINENEITGGQIRHLIETINGKLKDLLDSTTYSPARILLTATPSFSGLSDPFAGKERLFFKEGRKARIPTDLVSALEATEYQELNKNHLDTLGKLEATPVLSAPSLADAVAKLPKSLQRKCNNILEGKVKDNMYIKNIHTIYFDALQEGLDIQDLERNILAPILREYTERHNSTKRIKDYLQNGFRFAAARSITDVARNISFTKECKWKHRICDCAPTSQGKLQLPTTFPELGALSFLKASLGMGKTYSVRQLQKAGKLGSILAVTNRVSLVESIAAAMDLDVYSKLGLNINENGIATTIHSLHRVYERFLGTKGTKTLFIDEADSTIQELLDSAIIGTEARDKILNALYILMLQCDYVILADGDTSSETVEAYSTIIGNVKQTITYQSEVPTLTDAEVYEHKSEADILGHMLTNATAGMGFKMLVVTDYGPKQIDELSFGIQQHCMSMGLRTPNIVEIHAESKDDDDVREIMDAVSPTKALHKLNVDIIIASPSVTSGIDFQKYFSHVYCITSSGLNSPAIRIQAICRERRPKFVHYWTSGEANGGVSTPAKCLSSFEEGMVGDLQTVFFLRKMREHSKYQFYIRYNLLKKTNKLTILPVAEENVAEYKALSMYKEEHINLYATRIFMGRNQRINNAQLIYKAVQHFNETQEIDVQMIIEFLESGRFKKAEKAYRFMSIPTLWDGLCNIMDSTALDAVQKKRYFSDLCVANLPKLYRAGLQYNNKLPLMLFGSMGIAVDKFMLWEPTPAIADVVKFCEFYSLPLPDCMKPTSTIDYAEIYDLL